MKTLLNSAFVSTCLITFAGADVLTPVQHFFGLGGQVAGADYEDLQSEYQGRDRAPFSAADSDLGVQEILAPTSQRAPVMLDVATSVYFTDNAPTEFGSMESSWLWYTRIIGAWRPHLANGWHADLGASQEFLWFDRTSAMNYENTTLRLGVVKSFADWDDTVLFARYEYQRLTSGSFADGDYFAHLLRVGVQKAVWETARQSVTAGVDVAYDVTASPESLERTSYGVELAHRYRFTPELYSLVSWRSTYHDFSEFGREDWAHSLGLELIWRICPAARANVSVFFDKNDSNTLFGVNDFEAWTAGVGVGFVYSF
jgi:hypothetical protein